MNLAILVLLYQFEKGFLRVSASKAGMFRSMESMKAVTAGEAVEASSEVSPASLEDNSLKSRNPWGITDIAKKLLSFCDYTDLRTTADVSRELRVASEEAKRDMPIISLNEKASEEY